MNEYEWSLMAERTGWTEADVLQRVAALIVTRGGEGSTIYTADGKPSIFRTAPARAWSIRPAAATPTAPACFMACCTAMTGRRPDASLRCWVRIKIESRGTQNHSVHAGRVPAALPEELWYECTLS